MTGFESEARIRFAATLTSSAGDIIGLSIADYEYKNLVKTTIVIPDSYTGVDEFQDHKRKMCNHRK